MMKSGLLAPQYGLGRTTLLAPDMPAPPLVQDLPDSPADPITGPKVTVKRRRQFEGMEASSVEAMVPSTPIPAPRVYRLELPLATVAPQAPAPASLAAAIEAQPPVAPKLRRRSSDAARRPTLVKHVVFEHPPGGSSSFAQPVLDDPGKGDARSLRDALARLDAELQKTARAQEAFRALDRLLSSLGIGKDAVRPPGTGAARKRV